MKFIGLITFFWSLSALAQENTNYVSILTNHLTQLGFKNINLKPVGKVDRIKNYSNFGIDCNYKANRCRITYSDKSNVEYLWVAVNVSSPIVLSKSDLFRGQIIEYSSLYKTFGDNFHCGSMNNTLKGYMPARVSKRLIEKSKAICKSDLILTNSILSGDKLSLMYKNIELKVRALSNGSVGDIIPVLVETSGYTVHGQIVSSKKIKYIGK